MTRVWLFLLALSLALGCSETPEYEAFLAVSEDGWHADSTARFQVEIKDSTARYAVIFHLRANQDYPFANLYLFRRIVSAEGQEYGDTANLRLADPQGRWLGEGVGAVKTFSRPFRAQALQFRETGTYTFEFTQAMRQDPLPGVESLGLTLYRENDG